MGRDRESLMRSAGIAGRRSCNRLNGSFRPAPGVSALSRRGGSCRGSPWRSSCSRLQACREDEQDRPLVYDKGTYLGQVDEKLDQDQVDALRQRAAEQQI